MRIDNPNLTITEYQFDAAERLTSVENYQDGGDMINAFMYSLDPVGNRVGASALYAVGQGQTQERDTAYRYDPLYRLIYSVDNEGRFSQYVYDASFTTGGGDDSLVVE